MPVITVALPSLQFGFNQAGFARKLTRYFVVPLGLGSSAVSHRGHGSIAVTSSSLIGVLCVVAATINRLAARRNWFNIVGCVLMLCAAYAGQKLERKQAKADEQSDRDCHSRC